MGCGVGSKEKRGHDLRHYCNSSHYSTFFNFRGLQPNIRQSVFFIELGVLNPLPSLRASRMRTTGFQTRSANAVPFPSPFLNRSSSVATASSCQDGRKPRRTNRSRKTSAPPFSSLRGRGVCPDPSRQNPPAASLARSPWSDTSPFFQGTKWIITTQHGQAATA